MTAIKHILCPVDASGTSEFALVYAGLLAKKVGAKLTVLNVYQAWSENYPDDATSLRDEIERRVRERATSELDSLVEQAGIEVGVQRVLRQGVPAAVIVQEADRLGADLIVIGTHGRSGVSQWLLGSVAERVVRSANQPVLTVRKPGQ